MEKVLQSNSLESGVLFGGRVGVLLYKSATVDQAWVENGLSFRNRLEKGGDVFQTKN